MLSVCVVIRGELLPIVVSLHRVLQFVDTCPIARLFESEWTSFRGFLMVRTELYPRREPWSLAGP